MPGPFFLSSFSSSTGHRNAERANAVAALAGSALQEVSPTLIVPQAFAQTLISTYALFRTDTHSYERVIHCLQALMALTQLVITIYLIYGDNTECKTDTDVCKTLILMQQLYKGTLVLAIVLGEGSKDEYRSVPPPANGSPPAANPPVENPPAVEEDDDDDEDYDLEAQRSPRGRHHRHHAAARAQPANVRLATIPARNRSASVHSAASEDTDPDVQVGPR